MSEQPIDKKLNKYRELFWDAFHAPALESEKYIQLWKELEAINDQLAGPLFAIFEKGECDYIFADKSRFNQINNADDLFDWLTEHNKEYAERTFALKPENDIEINDQKVLLYQCDIKMELIEIAHEIISERLS